MSSPRLRPGPASAVALLAAVSAGVAAVPALGEPSSTTSGASLSSWSVAPSAFFQDTFSASATAVANGRIWQVSFDRQTKPVLRSRRLADGHASAVAVKIPRPPGSDLLTDGDTAEGRDARDTQLFVAGTRGFVAGDWCTEQDDDGDCVSSRGFSVQFDTRTGKVLRSSAPRRSPLLIGGTRVSYLVIPKSGSMQLRDAITRRLVRRIPHDAREIQGAGPFVSWKDPDAYERENGAPGTEDIGPDWSAIHVRVRTTGRVVYDLRASTLTNAIQRRTAGGQDVDLRPDGSLRLAIDLDQDRPFRPVVVDSKGRVRRVSERSMKNPIQFWSEVSGDRVSLQVGTNFGRCGTENGWLTDIGGHDGNALRGLPHSRGYAINGMPSFLSPTTMTWSEKPTDPDAPTGRSRERVGRDFRTLPLTRSQRPRC